MGKVDHEDVNVDVDLFSHFGRRSLRDNLACASSGPAEFAGPCPVEVGGRFPPRNHRGAVSTGIILPAGGVMRRIKGMWTLMSGGWWKRMRIKEILVSMYIDSPHTINLGRRMSDGPVSS